MHIRQTEKRDLEDVLFVERTAFGSEEEAKLVSDLLGDSSAEPIVSLLAYQADQPIGHVLFTNAKLDPELSVKASILAPLAVIPEFQNQGVGAKLAERGIIILERMGIDLVFVLGHPTYYPKFGFEPAIPFGLDAPYPIPEKNHDAWMVRALSSESKENCNGKVICADMMMKPEYWRE